MRLDVKFALAVGVLSLSALALSSWLLLRSSGNDERLQQEMNQRLDAALEQEARSRTNTVANFGEACRAYTHKIMAPALAKHLGNTVVLEAQSRTFVARGVFAELRQMEGMKQFRFREAALNPLNPENQADPEEGRLIQRFTEDRNLKEQQGILTSNGSRLFYVARPIVVDRSCLQCHGAVADAPKEIIARYGTKHGYGWKEGQIGGVLMVTVPAEDLLAEMAHHQKAAAEHKENQDAALKSLLSLFAVMTAVSIAGLFGLFQWLINGRLRRATNVMRQMTQRGDLSVRIADSQRDEIGELARSFNAMAEKIEEQTRAAKEADAMQKRLVAILEASPDFIGFAKPNMEIQYINRAGRAMVGIGATEDIAGVTIPAVHPAWFLEQMQEQMRVGLPKDLWIVEGAFKNRGGTEIPVSMVLVAHRAEDGSIDYYSTISRDITERKRVERELVKEKDISAMLVESMPGIVYFANERGLPVRWNKNLESVSGYSASEIAAMPAPEFFIPEDRSRLVEEIQGAIETGMAAVEAILLTRNGQKIPYFFTGMRLIMEDRPHVIGVGIDISNRIRAEENLTSLNAELQRHAAELETALAESEEFAYAAAHNLRSPLRGIDGFCQIILEEEGDRLTQEGRQHVDRVRQAAQTMAGLIEALLKLSRLSRMKMDRQTIDLSALARSIADSLMRREPERKVELVIPDGFVVDCDGPLAQALLEELLENAWKFTTAHPQARIEFGNVRQPDEPLTFFVRDDGVGFDMAYADKLFVPFQHLHSPDEFPGTGIGLATVQRIVRRHGGRVWAEGSVGHGATFYFTLSPLGGRDHA